MTNPKDAPGVAKRKKVAVTGATGLIGAPLTRALLARGEQVVALTRSRQSAQRTLDEAVEIRIWPEPKVAPPPSGALTDTDAVVHLLGEPVAQRWNEANKREIRDSRVLSTRSLVQGIRELAPERRPRVLVSQSATGYYGPRANDPVSESVGAGEDFLSEVTRAWEAEALAAAKLPGVRVVLTRTGVVLSPQGGALAKMLPAFRMGLGGPVSGGGQYVSWIHLDDVVAALLKCIDDPAVSGPVNLTAPNPVTNAELTRTLARVLHRPAVLPVPEAALRVLYGEMASIITTGARVVPDRLGELGYDFRQPDLEPALRDVLGRA